MAGNPFMMVYRESIEKKTPVTVYLKAREIQGVVTVADLQVVELLTDTGRVLLRADCIEAVGWT
jgi:hypothetical protein